jgi:hypothetical protein
MINLEFYTEFDKEQITAFQDAAIDMDDWGYAVFIPNGEGLIDKELTYPAKYLDRLLNGCWDNRWYNVTLLDRRHGLLGVAYHA